MRPLLAPILSLTALLFAATTARADSGVMSTAPSATTPPATQDAEARYQSLLAQAKANAPESDWAGLRFAYAARPNFKAFGQNEAKSAMFKDVEAGDCDKALADAKAVIDVAYVDADAHLVTAFCDDKAGDKEAARLERDIGIGLLDSIQSADGTTPATAFVVIDVDEEYALMRAAELKVTDQALIQQGGHTYDAITTLDDKGVKATYYFLIDKVLAAEASALKPGAVSEGSPPDRGP